MSFTDQILKENQKKILANTRAQATIKTSVKFSGIAIFTGQIVTIVLEPREENYGIVFQRTDLPNEPILKACLKNVKSTPRCTVLGDEHAVVQTVEHLLATLYAYGISNIHIKIDGPEVPIGDGSSSCFVQLIEEAGVEVQNATRVLLELKQPIYWSHDDIHLVALPSDVYRISYTLYCPQSTSFRSQFYSLIVDADSFKREISTSRTFAFYEEIAPLLESGKLKGTLDNGVIIREDKILNEKGFRFPEEMARHKILDIIGDLSLIEAPILAHIIALRAGHFSNNIFAKELMKQVDKEI